MTQTIKPILTVEQFAARFNVSVEQVKEQYRATAKTLRQCADKAATMTGKYRGATAADWEQHATWYENYIKTF